MRRTGETLEQTWRQAPSATAGASQPRLFVLFADEAAQFTALPARESFVLGRGDIGGLAIDDGRLSRRHCEVSRVGARWRVRDLDSRNGTFVNGTRVGRRAPRRAPTKCAPG